MKKKRKSRINKDKALAYKAAYLTNGFNKTRAYMKANPTATLRNAEKHCTQNHEIVENSGILKPYEELKKEVIEKAWKKVKKALDKTTDKADMIAKDLAVKDIKDKDINIHTNIVNSQDKEALRETLRKLRDRDKVSDGLANNAPYNPLVEK